MKRGTPMTNSNARKRLEAQRPHPDPAVCELMARAWDEGEAAGRNNYSAYTELMHNPYRSAS